MNKYARIIGIAFVFVTVLSASTLALTVETYQAVADAQLRLRPPDNIYVSEIRIPPIYDLDTPARVTLLIEFRNPSRLDVWVYNIEFSLYMFNETTMQNMGDPQILQEAYVWLGGFFRFEDPDYFVPSGGNATLYAYLTVTNPNNIRVLNTTDTLGLYHPLVTVDLRYTIVDVDIPVTIRGIYYFSQQGVEPYEG